LTALLLPFAAGLLTTFSPCVIPVIPLVVGSASRSSRMGPIYLLIGLVTSFSVAGTFATSVLFSLGLSPSILSDIGALLLILVGVFLLFSSLDSLFKKASGGFSNTVNSWLNKVSPETARGQFVIGLFIGLIWLPCTGPTLGAAIGMAAQGENLVSAFFTMLSFSLGAVIPLGFYAFAGQYFTARMEKFTNAGSKLRKAFALLFIFVGVAIYTGWHKKLEAKILEFLPDWWVNMITSI